MSETLPGPAPTRNNTVPVLAFVFFAGVALTFFLVPGIVIQPFKFQSSRGLAVAVALREWGRLWAPLAAVSAWVVALMLWTRLGRWWKKSLLCIGLLFASFAGVMSRVDYFEWMFNPIKTAGFDSAASSKLAAYEMVMAIRFGNDARAYPIYLMAYHHVFNDVVGDVPVAVTY